MERPDFSDLNILYVGSDYTEAARARSLFRQSDVAEFNRAATANEAQDVLRMISPNFLIIEMEMPRATGLQFLAELRDGGDDRFQDLPTLLLLKSIDPEQMGEAKRLKIDGLLQKPVSEGRLYQAAVEALRRHKRLVFLPQQKSNDRRRPPAGHFQGLDRRQTNRNADLLATSPAADANSMASPVAQKDALIRQSRRSVMHKRGGSAPVAPQSAPAAPPVPPWRSQPLECEDKLLDFTSGTTLYGWEDEEELFDPSNFLAPPSIEDLTHARQSVASSRKKTLPGRRPRPAPASPRKPAPASAALPPQLPQQRWPAPPPSPAPASPAPAPSASPTSDTADQPLDLASFAISPPAGSPPPPAATASDTPSDTAFDPLSMIQARKRSTTDNTNPPPKKKMALPKNLPDNTLEILTKHMEWLQSDGANGIQGNLSDTDFSETELTGLNLSKLRLRGTKFIKANCRDMVFSYSDLTGANFFRSRAQAADFGNANLVRANFTKSALENAEFAGADLRGANFRQALITKADFQGANLLGSDFSGTDMSHAKGITDAQLKKIKVDGKTLLPINVEPSPPDAPDDTEN